MNSGIRDTGIIHDEEPYDVVVVGSGPAGYSAAIHAARDWPRVLFLAGFEIGGQIMLSPMVESYPGFEDGITGPDLAERFEEQAVRAGVEIRPDNVERVEFSEPPFKLWVSGDDLIQGEPTLARSVIVATGAKPRWLGLESEMRLMGRGVSGCAICDGFFFKDKQAAVVGGGNRAMEEALYLTQYASHVTLIHRREEFQASRVMLERVKENPQISLLTDTVVERIMGEKMVEALWTRNLQNGEQGILWVNGVFVAVGSKPNSGLFRGVLETDGEGYIIQKEGTMTSVPGVFAAGEVADKEYRQVASAVGDGCRSAIEASRWLWT